MDGIFVVGTGRSGTHFTIRLLSGFENTRDPLGGRENPKILRDIATAAIHHRLPSDAVTRYYEEHFHNSRDLVFLDQHHPNLFFMQHWQKILEPIVFLYPKRATHQVVASMMRHEGVMSWYNYAKRPRQRILDRIPYPNRFLGLKRFDEIRSLPIHLLCAHRVIAHRLAFENALADMKGELRVVNYAALIENPLNEFSKVFSRDELKKLGQFTTVEEPNPASLEKFRDVLTDEQVMEISDVEKELTKKQSENHG